MMPASLRFRFRRAAVVGAFFVGSCAAVAGVLAAQSSSPSASRSGAQWSVKGRESLAWWQVEPNYGHLWATTCPGDPSWSAGESRSSGYAYRDEGIAVSAKLGTRIPLFPRGTVTPVCSDAVHGDITISDTVHWRGVSGTLIIDAQKITTGADFRDAYAQKAVLKSNAYPEIKFQIDSLTEVHVEGDTIRATAVGSLGLVGREHPKSGRVVAWRVPGGLRVRAQLQVPAKDMINVFGMSKFALNMGVVLGRWDTLYMGIDIILKAPVAGA
jgi:hypothetical protein